MDRLIWIAWRALWLTVGGCAVLIAQSFAVPDEGQLASPPPAAAPYEAAPVRNAPVGHVGSPTGAGVTTTSWLSTVATPLAPRPVSCVVGTRSC